MATHSPATNTKQPKSRLGLRPSVTARLAAAQSTPPRDVASAPNSFSSMHHPRYANSKTPNPDRCTRTAAARSDIGPGGSSDAGFAGSLLETNCRPASPFAGGRQLETPLTLDVAFPTAVAQLGVQQHHDSPMKIIMPPAIAVALCTVLTVVSSHLAGVDDTTLKTIAWVTLTVSGSTAFIVTALVALISRKTSKTS